MSIQQERSSRRTLKTLLVEPFKQIKLGLYVIALCLTFTVVVALIFVNSFLDQYQHVMEIFQVVDPDFQWEVVTNDVFYTNAYRLAAILATFMTSLFYIVFRSTHKFYGPLISVERFVDQIAEGDYSSRVIIRRGDELQRLVQKLNDMAQLLEERHEGQPRRRASDRLDTRETDDIAG